MRQLLENILKDMPQIETQLNEDWKTNLAAGAIAAGLALSPMAAGQADAKPAIVQDVTYSGLSSEVVSKIKQLHDLASKKGIAFKVIEGYRSQARQNELYAQGRTKPGKKVTWTTHSKHTSGRAFDVMMLKNGKGTWDYKEYLELGKLGKSIGLTWGGDFKGKDFGHFQLD